MNFITRMTVLAIVVSSFAPLTSGLSQENQTASQDETKPQVKWIAGSVSQVGFAKSIIKLFTDKGYFTFSVLDNTTISIGSQKVWLDEIKTKDSVRIQYYSPSPGNYIAIAIFKNQRNNE